MKVFTYFILSVIIFSLTSQCINTINLDQHISLQKLKKDPQIQISITEPLLEPIDQENATKNLEFFILKSASRHKNKAYQKILKNYQKLVNILVQKLIIGDERLLIKSKIKQKYLKKKRLWEFGIMFMMQGQGAEIEQCYHEIVKLGVTKMNSKPYTSAMNQGIIASDAFYKMKQKIWKQLERMPGMTILKVDKVEIKGLSIPNSIGLQKKQIDTNTEDNKDDNNNDQMSYISDFFFVKAQNPQQSKSVTIKCVFEVGEQQEPKDDDTELESSQSEFESESQYNAEDNQQKTHDSTI